MDKNDWLQRFEAVQAEAPRSVREAGDEDALEAARVSQLGRKGRLTELLKALKDFGPEEKRELGPKANALREELSALIDGRRKELARAAREAEMLAVKDDLTLPGVPHDLPPNHPITRTIEDLTGALRDLGFAYAEGPLVEDDFHNFEALNIPEDHSSRDMQDTFYLKDPASGGAGLLLRTHTSPVQIRALKGRTPPLRVQAPGRVFRHEAVDASHSAVFHQVEGLYVDREVSMADLKWTLETFLKRLFGPEAKLRLRPSYFPFTEPSAEVDLSCLLCAQKGCSACKRSGWLELLGAGLVHPKVLEHCGVDPEAWSGFAFGVGVERVAMLRYGIRDIRMFYENDLRFLEQFR